MNLFNYFSKSLSNILVFFGCLFLLAEVDPNKEAINYVVGVYWGKTITAQQESLGINFHTENLQAGLFDSVESSNLKYSHEEVEKASNYISELQKDDASEILNNVSKDQANEYIRIFSYHVGYMIGGVSAMEIINVFDSTVDLDSIVLGINDIVNNKNALKYNNEQIEEVFAYIGNKKYNYQIEKMNEKRNEEIMNIESDIAKNLIAAEKFLADNKLLDGVEVTDSGLQYQVLKLAESDKVTAKIGDKVSFHYELKLLDGNKVDSSYDRSQTLDIELSEKSLIGGVVEGLQLMQVGDKFKFFIHPDLGYGDMANPSIPGNSLLLFEIELVAVSSD